MKLRNKTKELFMISFLTFLFSTGVIEENEFQITAEPHDQRWPAIYDNIVVWQDNRNGNWDIYGIHLSTLEEFQITTDQGDQLYPAIYKEYVIFLDERHDRGDLYGFNLSTGEEFKIPTESDVLEDPAIYDNIIVWEGRQPGLHIYGYNLSTQHVFQISTHPGGQRNPAIYENYVVWEDRRDDYDTIYVLNLSTSCEFQIKTIGQYFREDHQIDPVIHNNIVVWADERHGNIYGYNLSTSRGITIAAGQMRPCRKDADFWISSRESAIYNDYVVWVDCRNGNRDIYGLNLVTKQEV